MNSAKTLRIAAALWSASLAADAQDSGTDSLAAQTGNQQSVVDLRNAVSSPYTSGGGVGAPLSNWAVSPSAPVTQDIGYDEFIHEVLQSNLDYAAQRYNVDVAQAQLEASRLLPNPTLQLAGDRDLTYHDRYATGTDGQPALLRQVEAQSIGLTQSLPLGGKRKWRIRVAEQTYRAAAATVDDFLRNLKVDASEAFAEALATQKTVEQHRVAADFLKNLVSAQEARFRAGDIGEADLVETRLEELQFRNELLKAEDDAQQARLALSTFLGRDRGQTSFIVHGRLEQSDRDYDLTKLIDQALVNRPDLVALRHARDAARSAVVLAKRQIIPDIDVGVTYTNNGGVVGNHPVDPTPGFHQLGLQLSIPLPLFDRGQYAVAAAKAQAEQAEVQLKSAEMNTEVSIRAADSRYRSARDRLHSFQENVLKSTDLLLQARRYSYQRGASSLFELLAAQRSANEVQQSYQDALADTAKALLELERATGLRDVRF